MNRTILETDELTKRFGAFTAVDGVSLNFHAGETTAIIGPNGAGKTTFFNMLSGVLAPTEGAIRFKGDHIEDLETDEVARAGIARSYQITNIFAGLTALENVRLSAQVEYTGYTPKSFFKHYSHLDRAGEDARNVLERVDLDEDATKKASELSHGMRRHLDIALALASDPDLLLLDEPTAGMSPRETEETAELIDDLAEEYTIAIIEHDMEVVMGVADRIAVMHNGRLLTVGTPEQVRNDDQVQEIYLRGGTVA